MKSFLALVVLLLLAGFGSALPATADQVFKADVGANGIWYDSPIQAFPSDIEAEVNGRESLSLHISGVESVAYGFNHSYLRGSFGARFAASNPNDKHFSIAVGAQYHVSSKTQIRPQEWAPDVTFGIAPWPDQLPDVTFGVSAWYGVKSKEPALEVAARYALPIGGQR